MSSIPPEGVVFSRPGRYYAGGVRVELMYATFTDYSGLVCLCVHMRHYVEYTCVKNTLLFIQHFHYWKLSKRIP